jgi:hypothetical protein
MDRRSVRSTQFALRRFFFATGAVAISTTIAASWPSIGIFLITTSLAIFLGRLDFGIRSMDFVTHALVSVCALIGSAALAFALGETIFADSRYFLPPLAQSTGMVFAFAVGYCLRIAKHYSVLESVAAYGMMQLLVPLIVSAPANSIHNAWWTYITATIWMATSVGSPFAFGIIMAVVRHSFRDQR